MLKNIKLLNTHRNKMSYIAAFVCYLLIIFTVGTIETILYQIENKSQNNLLEKKFSRIEDALDNGNIIAQYNNNDTIQHVLDDILKDSYIFNANGENILKTGDLDYSDLKEGKIKYINGYKYYLEKIENSNQQYTLIVREVSRDSKTAYLQLFFLFLIFSPFIYFLLIFIWSRMMKTVYRPIESMIVNLESFASNINHEFKTSISEILSSLELASITQEYEKANNFAISSTKRLNNILDVLGLFVYFTNSEYRRQKVDLLKLLDEDINEFSKEIKEKNLQIVKKFKSNSHIIKFIDKEPLLLAFRNILKNAIKYSHEGGTIEIYIGKKHFGIKDYGVGISKENIDKIFNRYFRENYSNSSGYGIGLSLIKKITEIYNWEVKIDSEKDKYTYVELIFENEKKES